MRGGGFVTWGEEDEERGKGRLGDWVKGDSDGYDTRVIFEHCLLFF